MTKTLVIFDKHIKLNNVDVTRFDTVLAPSSLRSHVNVKSFISIESMIGLGSANAGLNRLIALSKIKNSDNTIISDSIVYKQFKLWWIHYNDLFHHFALPSSQYQKLLEHIGTYDEVYLYQPPFRDMFEYYLQSHGVSYSILGSRLGTFPKLGIWIQLVISIISLPILMISRPRLMVWTSDRFDKNGDYDFRMKEVYAELRSRNIKFVEFIRSMESLSDVVRHALKRKRPVIYSGALIHVCHWLARFFSPSHMYSMEDARSLNEKDKFWMLVGIHYARYTRGDIWAIRIVTLILRLTGIRSAIIPSSNSRTFIEIISCKIAGIKTAGIQHGASSKYSLVSDFMTGFSGRSISTDTYGLWSEWWKQYYIDNSSIFTQEQLKVSGPMRPYHMREVSAQTSKSSDTLKVLIISEQAVRPEEVAPYVHKLTEDGGFQLFLKTRHDEDVFEQWLGQNMPDVLSNLSIVRDDIHDAISQADIVLGSYSTGALEAFLHRKPAVFMNTERWGDYFDIQKLDLDYSLFAESPDVIIERVKSSMKIEENSLQLLKERFFGVSGMNGSKWVVSCANEAL